MINEALIQPYRKRFPACEGWGVSFALRGRGLTEHYLCVLTDPSGRTLARAVGADPNEAFECAVVLLGYERELLSDPAEIPGDAAISANGQAAPRHPVTLRALQARFSRLGFDRLLRLRFAGMLLVRPPLISFSDLDADERLALMQRVNYIDHALADERRVVPFAQFVCTLSMRCDNRERCREALRAFARRRQLMLPESGQED